MNEGASAGTRRARGPRPEFEALEGRALLSANASTSTVAASQTTISQQHTPGAVLNYDYTTSSGARVDIRLYGVGTLKGTCREPNGALDLRYSGTNSQTGIIAKVVGGTGTAQLNSILPLNVSAQTLSGIGVSLLNIVNLRDFDLIPGGQINLTGGVHALMLNSIGANTQVNVRELPESLSGSTASLASTSSSSSTTSTSTSGTVAITAPAFPAPANGTFTQGGVTTTYSLSPTGAQTLTSVSGVFSGTATVPNTSTAGDLNQVPNPPQAPPGVVIAIQHVLGPSLSTTGIGNPQVFAYDATTGSLVRYDTRTGQPTLTIPNALPVSPNTEAGVTLARNGSQLVVLVSNGATVYAYDADTGAAAGSFSLAPLMVAPYSLTSPTRLGTYDAYTVVGDATGGWTGLGELQAINVAQSLQTGQAVALTDPSPGNPVVPSYTSLNAFQFTGGFASVPGSNTLFAAGAGHFDTYQPNQYQLGVASLSSGVPSAISSGAALKESSRGALTGNGTPSHPSNPNGTPGTLITTPTGANPTTGQLYDALGNVDLSLALITGQGTDPNTSQPAAVVTLYNPTTMAKQSTVYLDTTDALTDLSGSFRPSLAGVALVDVQGNTQSFRASDAQGLVFSDQGNINLVKINSAVDSTVIGYPLTHVQMPLRQNVELLSGTRKVGERGNVTQVVGLPPTGPLSLP